MGTCSVENCDYTCFENEDKCVLHCEKDDKNTWYKFSYKNEKIWDNSKVDEFWHYIHDALDAKYRFYCLSNELLNKEYILSNIIFPEFQPDVEVDKRNYADKYKEGTNFYSYGEYQYQKERKEEFEYKREVNRIFNKLDVVFDKCTFLDIVQLEKYNFENHLIFENCIFENEIQLNKIYKNRISFLACTINNLNCKDIIFEQKVKILNCTINGKANFYNTKFKELADLYRTKFNEVVFEKTDFENISVFSEAEFNKGLDFKYTKFLDKSIFRDTVIKGKLNLRDTIFADEANFLDITSEKRKKNERKEFYGEPKVIQVSNRETARIIKNFYDSSNNIIEANKFYALEMKEREYELGDGIKGIKTVLEYMVFQFHGISSNHSQDWILPLLWIFNISFIYSIFTNTSCSHDNVIASIVESMILFSILINLKTLQKISLITSALILKFFTYINLDIIAKNINPFSIMTSQDPVTFDLLFFKAIMAYLIYQFIISVRQNTRRK